MPGGRCSLRRALRWMRQGAYVREQKGPERALVRHEAEHIIWDLNRRGPESLILYEMGSTRKLDEKWPHQDDSI